MTSLKFALDIGTRTVVGTILEKEGDQYRVLDLLSVEHKDRSMIDGQIHNIGNVAEVIKKIKGVLEEKHGPLKKVSVAAAGRALITKESEMTIDLTKDTIASAEDTYQFELAAVQKAQQSLVSSRDHKTKDAYFCVGYSVLYYTLDGQKIGDLIDQTGKEATIHVIATFLPEVVVESLLAALRHADLEMAALTLEPIAAIHVLVPPSMRKLNIALVDIGAGTSDIAIADQGTITAYGMVPLAGDEVTDALSQQYLVDFPVAEAIKRQLTTAETVEIEDILGFKQNIASNDVCDQIEETIGHIALEIAHEIKRLNRDASPQAVILVGGGSLTPKLARRLSSTLQLPENRVGIRGLEALNDVQLGNDYGQAPELVTPIGIAIAADRSPLQYMHVTINGKNTRLFEGKKMTVGDAFIAAGLPIQEMIGRPGNGITFTFNGKTVAVPGQMGQASRILVNGKQASTKSIIQAGDIIELKEGRTGRDAAPLLKDCVEIPQKITITIHGQSFTIKPLFLINGKNVSTQTQIHDRDIVTMHFPKTLQEIFIHEELVRLDEKFEVRVDQQLFRLNNWEKSFLVNGVPVSLSYLVKNGDQVTIHQPPLPRLKDVKQELNIPFSQKITVYFNDKAIDIDKPMVKIVRNDEQLEDDALIRPNDILEIHKLTQSKFVFSDIFVATNYELPKHATGSYALLRNDEPIQLTDEIFQHDRLEIKFNFNYS